MNPHQSTLPSKTLTAVSWVLSLLFTLKSLDFFFSINWNNELSNYLVLIDSLFFLSLGVSTLLLARGIFKKQSWARIPLLFVLIANLLLVVFYVFVAQNWFEALFALLGAGLLAYYLQIMKGLWTGKRFLLLHVFLIITLLPSIIFLLLSISFQDEALQEDTLVRLSAARLLSDTENIYSILATEGTTLPEIAQESLALLEEYPNNWNRDRAEIVLKETQTYVDLYASAANIPEYQCLTTVNDFSQDAESCALNFLRDYALLMQFAAFTQAELGNIALAREYALAPIKVGKAITESSNVSVLEYMVGVTSVRTGLDTINTLFERSPSFVSDNLSDTLQTQVIPANSLATPLKREYMESIIALDEYVDAKQNYFYHPNRTRNELSARTSRIIEDNTQECVVATGPNSTLNTKPIADIADLQENPFYFSEPNAIGRVYLSTIITFPSALKDSVCEINRQISDYRK